VLDVVSGRDLCSTLLGLDDLRWHDIRTKFHDNRLRYPSIINELGGYSVGIADETDSSSLPLR
jgi:hypothetical protein